MHTIFQESTPTIPSEYIVTSSPPQDNNYSAQQVPITSAYATQGTPVVPNYPTPGPISNDSPVYTAVSVKCLFV